MPRGNFKFLDWKSHLSRPDQIGDFLSGMVHLTLIPRFRPFPWLSLGGRTAWNQRKCLCWYLVSQLAPSSYSTLSVARRCSGRPGRHHPSWWKDGVNFLWKNWADFPHFPRFSDYSGLYGKFVHIYLFLEMVYTLDQNSTPYKSP